MNKFLKPPTLYITCPIIGSAPRLRCFFTTQFTEYSLLPPPSSDRLIYHDPPAQYKTIDGVPMVIGINHSAEISKQIYDKYYVIKHGDHEN
ncbi:MAG: hypothetical protein J5U19_10630 [Candidatus Methanoperedens sp.]|nr:hypothetical protein [Candidatus Methanoperedens sp.]